MRMILFAICFLAMPPLAFGQQIEKAVVVSSGTGSRIAPSELKALPPALDDSFHKCQSSAEYFSPPEFFKLQNQTLITACMARHRLIWALANDDALRKQSFVCSVGLEINRRRAPFASVITTKPSRCDVAGQKIEAQFTKLLMGVAFDPIAAEIGDSILIDMTVRVEPSNGAKRVSTPLAFTQFRGQPMQYEVSSRILTFANKDKLPPPPPDPNCKGECGMGMSIKAEDPAKIQAGRRLWEQAISAKVSFAVTKNRQIWTKLKKEAFSFDVRLYVNPDQEIVKADIMQASGTALELVDKIRSILLAQELPVPAKGSNAPRYFGEIRMHISSKQ